jgi:hypothetical protein
MSTNLGQAIDYGRGRTYVFGLVAVAAMMSPAAEASEIQPGTITVTYRCIFVSKHHDSSGHSA